VVFGAFHFTGDSIAEGLFIVGVTAAYGAVLAVLATTTRRLGAPIVAHMVINGVGVAAALLT
jgi:membrane protease YdiL (CAAX protease family)